MRVVSHPVPSSEWDDFVATMPDATCYHQSGWKGVIESSFGHQGHYLTAVDCTGKLSGILPLVHMKSRMFGSFLVSLPFVNYGGLLSCNESAERELFLRAEALRESLSASYVEFRNMNRQWHTMPVKSHKVTMILKLEVSTEKQWLLFNAKLRNQIRKAQKSGLTVTIGHMELLDNFYAVFARNMHDLGTPVYGIQFFRNLLEEFKASTYVFLVCLNGIAVAAGIAVCFRDTLEIPWASSNADYKTMCPNNLLYWEAIKFAIERGFARFDFGRSSPGGGTYNFKRQWGAESLPLKWQYMLAPGTRIPHLDPGNPKYRLAIWIWRKLPLLVTTKLGPSIVRNIS